MRLPARTIWDVRVQSVCSVVSVRDGAGVELWMCGNFAQASLDPPRLIINPNRVYPIEPVILRERRFAVNVFRDSQRTTAFGLMQLRRREPNKAQRIGLVMVEDEKHGIPYAAGCLQTLFCELEQVLDTGDHTVMIARVLESRAQSPDELPLLFPQVSGSPSKRRQLDRIARSALTLTGAKDFARKLLQRRRGGSAEPVDIARITYNIGGHTDEAIQEIASHGLSDTGRIIFPPVQAPAILRRRLPVCVVGVGAWGSVHCQLFKQADPKVDLYVCGRDENRVARVAHSVGAVGYILGLERAVEDKRIEAMSLVLPHHLHSQATRLAAEAGKHVLVEKPVATTLEAADEMIAVARRAGTILMVAENMHFRPDVREAALAISHGDLGEPLYWSVNGGGILRPAGWKSDIKTMGGGVLLDLGIHYIRTLRLLMGEPDRVFATKAMQVQTKIQGEDSGQVLFSSSFGWQGHLLVNWSSPRGDAPDIVVAGEQGVVHLWGNRPFYDFYPATARPITQFVSYVRPAWLSNKLMRPSLQRVRRRIANPDHSGYLTEIREFLAAVTEQRSPVTSAEDGRRDLEIALFMYESLRREAWVAIPPPPAAL
jgi:predicted dehydrogenase/flavin reductase (DIM6/NTAB) family NADH-FMN oxidoreductase RutF